MNTSEHILSPPPLEDIASILATVLQSTYTSSSATVVQCPDLRLPPFRLASAGLGGNESVADIGGQAHLFPRPVFSKKYSLLRIAELMNLDHEHGMLIGAGAGPFHVLQQNSELAADLCWQERLKNVTNQTRFTKIDNATGKLVTDICPSTDCALMMNVFGSAGDPGPVLRVTARGRRPTAATAQSFPELVRQSLQEAYGTARQVSMGGVLVLKRGTAKFHVMPDFPPETDLPFTDRGQLEQWLTYHDFAAPMVCLSVLHSCDPQGLGLRMEHTHCFSGAKGGQQGGHYHYDLLPVENGEEVEYEAYFNSAKVMYRIDQPDA
nr:ester hydrolase c11orf54 like [Quercus suber]